MVSSEAGSWSDVVRRKGGSKSNKLYKLHTRSKTIPGDTKKQSPPFSLHSNKNQDTKQKLPRARAQVEGKRKVWGTLKTCSTAAVKSAISTLTNVPSDKLSIRRKWFVIGVEERVLAQLQEQWHSVKLQTKWKLEPVFCYTEDNLCTRVPTEPPQPSDESTSSKVTKDLVLNEPPDPPCTQSKHAPAEQC